MKELSKVIQKICNTSKVRNNPKQVIDDLMQLGFNFFYEGTLNRFTGCYQKLGCNEKYVVELSDYKKDLKAWELLQEAWELYMHEVKDNELFADVIGMQYDEYLGSTLGQFLTPPDVAEALAMLQLQDFKKRIEAKEHFNIADICNGAGALLLGALRVIVNECGKEALRYVHIMGNDLDPAMCRMCAVQLLFPSFMHNAPIGSVNLSQGNTITDYEKGFDPVIVAVKNVFDYDIYRRQHGMIEATVDYIQKKNISVNAKAKEKAVA